MKSLCWMRLKPWLLGIGARQGPEVCEPLDDACRHVGAELRRGPLVEVVDIAPVELGDVAADRVGRVRVAEVLGHNAAHKVDNQGLLRVFVAVVQVSLQVSKHLLHGLALCQSKAGLRGGEGARLRCTSAHFEPNFSSSLRRLCGPGRSKMARSSRHSLAMANSVLTMGLAAKGRALPGPQTSLCAGQTCGGGASQFA